MSSEASHLNEQDLSSCLCLKKQSGVRGLCVFLHNSSGVMLSHHHLNLTYWNSCGGCLGGASQLEGITSCSTETGSAARHSLVVSLCEFMDKHNGSSYYCCRLFHIVKTHCVNRQWTMESGSNQRDEK